MSLLDQLEPGDHVCWAVDDEQTRLDTTAGLLAAGLRARHRAVYCGGDPAAVLARLARLGVDTAAALAAGRLSAVPAGDGYLTGGVFDPVATLATWRRAVEQARADGYRGLRVVGDMSWAARPVAGVDRLAWYEAQVTRICTDGYLTGVCAYDRRLFDPMRLRRLAQAHPGAAGPRLPFDPASSLRIRRTAAPPGLHLSGEADISTRAALGAVLAGEAATLPAGAELTLDLTGLRFLDSAAARTLLHAAGAARGRVRIIGCAPALVWLLTFHGAAAVPGLTVCPPARPAGTGTEVARS